MSSFYANILSPKEYKAKLYVQKSCSKHNRTKKPRKMLMKLTPDVFFSWKTTTFVKESIRVLENKTNKMKFQTKLSQNVTPCQYVINALLSIFELSMFMTRCVWPYPLNSIEIISTSPSMISKFNWTTLYCKCKCRNILWQALKRERERLPFIFKVYNFDDSRNL